MSNQIQHRLPFLIETNLKWLRQAEALLQSLSDSQYTATPLQVPGQRAGSHMRHILEFYECLLAGLQQGRIDFDARPRDESVETSRQAALARVRSLIDRFESAAGLADDATLWIRLEGAGQARLWHGYVASTLGRELQTLSSHTIHHFAIIGFILRLLSAPLPVDFGVAPSTLHFRASDSNLEAA